jgi:hypothetical protein
MTVSLLLALLESHEHGEADRTRDYFDWIGAIPDSRAPHGWRGGKPERVEIVMRALYDILHSSIYPATPERIGTVLARVLTNDTDEDNRKDDLPALAKELRESLRKKMLFYLDTLRDKY